MIHIFCATVSHQQKTDFSTHFLCVPSTTTSQLLQLISDFIAYGIQLVAKNSSIEQYNFLVYDSILLMKDKVSTHLLCVPTTVLACNGILPMKDQFFYQFPLHSNIMNINPAPVTTFQIVPSFHSLLSQLN